MYTLTFQVTKLECFGCSLLKKKRNGGHLNFQFKKMAAIFFKILFCRLVLLISESGSVVIFYIGTYQLACHKSKMFWSPLNNLVRNGSHLKKKCFFFLFVFLLLGASWAMASLDPCPTCPMKVAQLASPGAICNKFFILYFKIMASL